MPIASAVDTMDIFMDAQIPCAAGGFISPESGSTGS